MSQFTKSAIVSSLLIVSVNSLVSFAETMPAHPGNALLIGLGVAQSSNVALFGQEQVAGARIAEELLNASGGINGTSFKVVLEDTGGDEAGAINAFNRLISQKVMGIVGPTLSQQAFSADPIADRQKVPVIGPSNTAKGIPQIGEFIARVSAPIDVVAPFAIKAALKLNPKITKAAVFYTQNDAFSVSETGTFQRELKTVGLNVTTVQKTQTSDTDFTASISSALATKPDLIVISALSADGGNLVKQLRQNGFSGPIVAGNGLNTSNIFPVCQKACDGLIIAQAYSPANEGKINREFAAKYREKMKKEPPQFSAQAFSAVSVMVEAAKRADKKSKLAAMDISALRIAVNKEIINGTFDTPLGEISFDKEGEVHQRNFYVAKIVMDASGKEGKFEYLK